MCTVLFYNVIVVSNMLYALKLSVHYFLEVSNGIAYRESCLNL